MVNKNAVTTPSTATLQRGKACLRCRKRKMRCDGSKPACQQCVRAKKGESCEYDDGKGKTRTQILKETISRLEHRIRELEDPEYISPAITLHEPHFFHNSESSSSSLGSPGSATYSGSHSPFQPESTSPPWINTHQLNSSPFGSEIFFEESPIATPFDLAPVLLNIFAPHRHQCGLEVHIAHLTDTLSLPLTEQRHPSLMNAIYLWACFVSRPEPLCEHEEYFLGQALEAQRQGLRLANKVLDVIQASCLLAVYFLANGRLLEGSYHCSAAAALAVQIGLHLVAPQESSATGWMSGSPENFDLKPQKGDYMQRERVLAFWQVYNLDQCWSVVLRKPTVIPDGTSGLITINCPWPQDTAEYESNFINLSPSYRTINEFLHGDVSSGGYSIQTLRAKASTLFAHADRLARSWNSQMKTLSTTQDEMRVLEMTISNFLTTLTPVHQLENGRQERQILIAIHTLAHTATILLYQRFAHEVGQPYEKCVQAANACVSIIKSLSTADFCLLDPILGNCWSTVADTLVQQLDIFESAWSAVNATNLRTDLTTLLIAMTNFQSTFPIIGLAISKLKARLEV